MADSEAMVLNKYYGWYYDNGTVRSIMAGTMAMVLKQVLWLVLWQWYFKKYYG